jgi:hypothetical protein
MIFFELLGHFIPDYPTNNKGKQICLYLLILHVIQFVIRYYTKGHFIPDYPANNTETNLFLKHYL